MNANERNEIVKLIQPNILPNTVELEVKVTVDETNVEEVKPVVEMTENIDLSLDNLELSSDDDDNEDIETDYDFTSLDKLQLVEILEETVQDTDVQKIKDKVSSIKSNFLRLCKEEQEKAMEQSIADEGENVESNTERTEDPLEIRFNAALDRKSVV